MKIQGVVLAGGESRRFGGDKAMARIHGMPMLERIFRLLKELDTAPLVITNAIRDYSFLEGSLARDILPGRGPLGGLYTACRIFRDMPLLVLSCDMPGITRACLEFLMACHDRGSSATVFQRSGGGGGYYPFPGIYESLLGEGIDHAMQEERLGMQDFLRRIPRVRVLPNQWEGKDGGVFLNLNEKKDLEFWETAQTPEFEKKTSVSAGDEKP